MRCDAADYYSAGAGGSGSRDAERTSWLQQRCERLAQLLLAALGQAGRAGEEGESREADAGEGAPLDLGLTLERRLKVRGGAWCGASGAERCGVQGRGWGGEQCVALDHAGIQGLAQPSTWAAVLQDILAGNACRAADAAGAACSCGAAAGAEQTGPGAVLSAALWEAGLGPIMAMRLGEGPPTPLPGGPQVAAGSSQAAGGSRPRSPSDQDSNASGGAGPALPGSGGVSGDAWHEAASSRGEPSSREENGGSGAGRQPGGGPACSGQALAGRAPSPLASPCPQRAQQPASPPAALLGQSQGVVEEVRAGCCMVGGWPGRCTRFMFCPAVACLWAAPPDRSSVLMAAQL